MRMNATTLAFAAFLMAGLKAEAQTCQQLMTELATRSATEVPMVFIAASQANKLTMSAARVGYPGASGGAFLFFDGANWTSSENSDFAAKMQFNDRINPGSLSGTSQNFASKHSLIDQLHVKIAPDGSVVDLTNLRWRNTMKIQNPTCSNGLMFGFGQAFGNNSPPAMYVLSFHYFP
jgi:hypothetical protein